MMMEMEMKRHIIISFPFRSSAVCETHSYCHRLQAKQQSFWSLGGTRTLLFRYYLQGFMVVRSIHLLILCDLQLNLNNLPGHLAYGLWSSSGKFI